jgi:hypothetical protein
MHEGRDGDVAETSAAGWRRRIDEIVVAASLQRNIRSGACHRVHQVAGVEVFMRSLPTPVEMLVPRQWAVTTEFGFAASTAKSRARDEQRHGHPTRRRIGT